MEEKKIEFYTCNKYFLDLSKEEIVLCNAQVFCDDETRARRKCQKVILTIEEQK